MSQKPIDILVAEDDDQVSYMLHFILTHEGFNVKVCDDGQEAKLAIDSLSPPRMVLLDIMMPFYNGYQLIDHIKQKPDWANVPIIMLSALSQEKDLVKAIEVGADDYIIKPFKPGELISKLKMLLRPAA